MTKREYLNLAMTMPMAWLKASTANPSASMRPIHITLCRIAIRRKSF